MKVSFLRILVLCTFVLANVAAAAPNRFKKTKSVSSVSTSRKVQSNKIYLGSNKSSRVSKGVATKVASTSVVSNTASKKTKNIRVAGKKSSMRVAKVSPRASGRNVLARSSKSRALASSKLASASYALSRASIKNEVLEERQEISESSRLAVEQSSENILNDFKGATYSLKHVGPFKNSDGRRYYEILPNGEKVVLTLDPGMQEEAENLLSYYNLPYSALVAIEPDTGRIKAMSGFSSAELNGQNLVARSSFPAASLFKMITASAAVETVGVTSGTPISYRGGTYALGKQNYLPNSKSDRMVMSLGQAMGKSCNPVFARVALNYLSPSVLRKYATSFGFGRQLTDDFPLRGSSISLGNDDYSFARTAAGFGDAYISPVHAASIVAAIGNRGLMMRPYLVEGVLLNSGRTKLLDNMRVMDQAINPSTAREILTMMENTVSEGTARKHFKLASPNLRNITVAAKTGTLKGPNPKGTYHWFTAVAPVENPKIAISALVIDNGRASVNGAGLGRRFLEKIFDQRSLTESAKDITKNSNKPLS